MSNNSTGLLIQSLVELMDWGRNLQPGLKHSLTERIKGLERKKRNRL
jgi:hypothetical protein